MSEELLAKLREMKKERAVFFTTHELMLLHECVRKMEARPLFAQTGEEDIELKDLEARLASILCCPVPVFCPHCNGDVSQPARVIKDGRVVASSKIIYQLSEEDIVDVVGQRGDEPLTPEQMDKVAHYVDHGLDPVGNWADVIEAGLEELEQGKKEASNG